jgi:prenyltransferase beta subunit
VTICQVMALRAARDAGIKVEKDVIDKAIGYVRRCQNPDGGFSYIAGSQGSGFARTAAGVCSLYYSGDYESESLKKGVDYLFRNMKAAISGGGEGHWHYGHYYGVQAMFQAGGKYWDAYYPAVRDYLVRQQRPDGSWAGMGYAPGNAYANAMSCIILQVPYRYLPVLQR